MHDIKPIQKMIKKLHAPWGVSYITLVSSDGIYVVSETVYKSLTPSQLSSDYFVRFANLAFVLTPGGRVACVKHRCTKQDVIDAAIECGVRLEDN